MTSALFHILCVCVCTCNCNQWQVTKTLCFCFIVRLGRKRPGHSGQQGTATQMGRQPTGASELPHVYGGVFKNASETTVQ